MMKQRNVETRNEIPVIQAYPTDMIHNDEQIRKKIGVDIMHGEIGITL